MKLIVGLGNPGTDYKLTRHNAGWLALDYIQKKWKYPEFKEEKKFSSLISSDKTGREKIILAKPLTYMNESGMAVRALLDFYKITPADLIVVHDDKDIPIGQTRVQTNRGPAGHNGVKSIIDHLGTKDFARIRVGIGPNEQKPITVVSHFVLHNFNSEEQKILNPVWYNVGLELEQLIKK